MLCNILKVFIYLYFIDIELIYSVMLISALQQSDSFILIYTFFFAFFSIMAYHRILNIVPCVILWGLVVYLTYIH